MVERARLESSGVLEPGAEHVLQRGVTIRGERPDALPHERNAHGQLRQGGERRHRVQAVIVLRLDEIERAHTAEIAVVEVQRMALVHPPLRVASPTGRDDVGAAVAVEISGRDAVPAADVLCEPPLRAGFAEMAVLVQE